STLPLLSRAGPSTCDPHSTFPDWVLESFPSEMMVPATCAPTSTSSRACTVPVAPTVDMMRPLLTSSKWNSDCEPVCACRYQYPAPLQTTAKTTRTAMHFFMFPSATSTQDQTGPRRDGLAILVIQQHLQVASPVCLSAPQLSLLLGVQPRPS